MAPHAHVNTVARLEADRYFPFPPHWPLTLNLTLVRTLLAPSLKVALTLTPHLAPHPWLRHSVATCQHSRRASKPTAMTRVYL